MKKVNFVRCLKRLLYKPIKKLHEINLMLSPKKVTCVISLSATFPLDQTQLTPVSFLFQRN